MQGINLEEWLKMLAGMSAGEEADSRDENVGDLRDFPQVRQACIQILKWRRDKIREKEQRIAALKAEREEEIREHDRLVDEIKRMDVMFAKATATFSADGQVDAGSSDEPKPPTAPPTENPAPPSPTVPQESATGKVDAEEPVIKKRRGRQAKFSPEFKRLSLHRPTGNARLDGLETALHDALERLNNTKMAFHFMAIKEVRLALSDLYKAWDKPEAERIAELETGLKAAVDKLSANPSAAQSKIMPEIWGDIIVALQENKDDRNQ